MTHSNNAEFWDQMYQNRHGHHHHGEEAHAPNPILAGEVSGLAPGTALDVGCGEGSDALWLAQRGWRVTGVDFSRVALDRARAHDREQQVSWVQGDLTSWEPPSDAFDLVTAHYLHLEPAERPAFFGRLARAVRPGGTLLFVAHHASDLETSVGRPAIPDLYFSAETVAGWLTPGRWEVLDGDTRSRAVTNRAGEAVTIQDMVLKARRVE